VDSPAPVPQPAPAPSLVDSLLTGAPPSPQGGRTGADAGTDTTPSFAFSGHAAPRPAAPVLQGAAATPSFASLVSSIRAADALPAETSTQIVQAIRIQMLREGGEAHIRLDPRQFGDLTVRIKVDQGQVTARVESDTAVVREWLQSNQHVLRQSLAGQQLTLDRLEVHEPPASDGDRREDGSTREQDRQQQRGQRQRRPNTGELFEIVA
jgi:flagellar hook-length control protein FliK